MLPGDEDVEEVEATDEDEETPSDDELFDFDDEVPAGEGVFAEESDGYAKKKAQQVVLTSGAQPDVKELLRQVGSSKKKRAR
jgi:hypothetical protein